MSGFLSTRFVVPLSRFLGTKAGGSWKDAVGKLLPKMDFEVTPDKTILYALGIGCSQVNKGDLRYLYENDKKFRVFPVFGVIPALDAFWAVDGKIPQVSTDLSRLLHGESYLEIVKPLLRQKGQQQQQLVSEARITDIVDKKSGATVVVDIETKCVQTGEKVIHNQFVCFYKGSGNFGGPRSSDKQRPLLALTKEEQARSPDAERDDKIGIDQNAIYRLSGDKNPLHIDPDFAKKAGFQTPILHGLCSLGYATRHVLESFSPAEFVSVKVRFSKPVFPGQTLHTKMWKRAGNGGKFNVLYQTSVKETGDVCLGGQVELRNA